MKTIGRIAEQYGISRTALLYYDSLGILSASSRSTAGYRLYSEVEEERLGRILILREAGIPLAEIKGLLGDSAERGLSAMLKRLGEINGSIRALKAQQRVILGLLGRPEMLEAIRKLDEESFAEILSGAEIPFERRQRWHEDFERQSPELHAQFLAIIGLDHDLHPLPRVAGAQKRAL